MHNDRRDFLKRAAVLTAVSQSRILGSNDRLRIAGLGTGGRCRYLLNLLNGIGGVEIVALCDIYEPHRAEARQKLAPDAKEYLDYREVLDRKDVDAVVIGSPDHWHTTMAIDAVRAGKDVYVEKPVTHTIPECALLRKAVADSGRVVQAGYQQRSTDVFLAGKEIFAAGKLGRVTLVLSSWYQNYLRNYSHVPVIDPNKLDWKRFLGSAPEQPFEPRRYASWRWYWDFGGGHLTDLYSHWCDVIQWYLGADAPLSAQAMGERATLPDYECPDTINASYTYPGGVMVVYDGTLNGSLDGGNIYFRGSLATMRINRSGLEVYPEGVVPSEHTNLPEPLITVRQTADGTIDHLRNFVDCVENRRKPNADVVAATAAAAAAHLGNLALRKGTRLSPDHAG